MINEKYPDKLDFFDIKQGTDSTLGFSHGNTLPYTQMPFGMVSFVPMTKDDPCYFQPYSHRLKGIRLTHQPSPWIGDYGQLLFMPQSGGFVSDPGGREASYRLNEAILRPGYIKINFLRYNADFELAPTKRGAAIRLTYEEDSEIPRFCIFSFDYETKFELDIENNEITGYTRALRQGGIREKFAEYFILKFHSAIDSTRTEVSIDGNISTGTGNPDNKTTVKGKNIGMSVAFKEKKVNISLAISYISMDQARVNLIRELEGRPFDEIRNKAADAWLQRLDCITVEDNNIERLRTFYTCLYRAHTFPHKFYEIAEDGSIWHYTPMDGAVRKGVSYVDNGFWDTSRTCYALYSIICPDDFAEMMEGFVNVYKDNGWLPKWLGPGEVGAMPGTLIDAVIADAAVKGICSRDILEKAMEGMIKHSEEKAPMPFYGRGGIEEYKSLGYVPYDKYGESVNHTLDYAYGDFCLARVAEVLGYDDIMKKYDRRAQNYRNLYNSDKGFMIGRDSSGRFRKDFDEFAWGRDYCEAGPWQASWAVFHDIYGLAKMLGGRQKMIEKIEKLHTMKPKFKTGGYNHEIHEMSEMAAVDFYLAP